MAAMIGSQRRTSSRRRASATAILLGLVGFATPVGAVEPSPSSNRLDQPMADLAILAPTDPDGPPRLLVVDALDSSPTGMTIRILERTRAWESIAETPVDLGRADLGVPWLIGTSPDRFVVIASSPDAGTSLLVGLRVVAERGGAAVEETARAMVDGIIADAGPADIDGDGAPELLLGTAPLAGAVCPESDLSSYDPITLEPLRSIHLPGRLVTSGVIGQFDGEAGDELLAYAEDACVDDATSQGTRLLAVRLVDGQTVFDQHSGARYEDAAVGPPMRIDLDGDAPHEAVAMTAGGLSILEPAAGWTSTAVATDRALPLVVGPDADAAGPATRLVWMESLDGSIHTARFRRGPDGAIATSGGLDFDPGGNPDRRGLTPRATLEGARRAEPAPGWLGGAVDVGCPDVIVPGAIMACGADAFRSGPAWIGTRPLLAMGTGSRRSLLVAAALDWPASGGLPAGPSPWAVGVAGWWRHGPSAAFALSEMRASDTTYFREFPVPLASVESTTAPEVTIDLPGFTGTRFFVRARAVAPDAAMTSEQRSVLTVLESRPDDSSFSTVVRVPVPPGVESGRDGSSTMVDLSRARQQDGSPAKRWAIDLVPLNDWGELGEVASGIVVRDERGPTLNFAVPLTTAVWPATASLPGSSEPDASVVVEGIGPMDLDRRGRFAIETTLAPWPQTYRITATDAAGNVTVREISVVGGVDYRRFPWLVIAAVALLGLVTARGMAGAGKDGKRDRGPQGRPATGRYDEGPRPEIEELPPGGGLFPR